MARIIPFQAITDYRADSDDDRWIVERDEDHDRARRVDRLHAAIEMDLLLERSCYLDWGDDDE